ncbi:phage tail tip lysozyme [Lactobacillus sp. AN1001]
MAINKKWRLALWAAAVSLLIYGMIIIVAFLVMIFGSNSDCKNDNSSEENTSITGVTGEWTNPGSQAYKTAEEVFKDWVRRGMNGAQAAGIVGNIGGAEDTGFVLNQAEIGGGSGGGLYQFTPASKYLNSKKSDKSWSVVNQADVIMDLEPGTVTTYFNKKHSSPEEAATDWMNMYERPSAAARAQSNDARRMAARKAYDLFGGNNIESKAALLGQSNEVADTGIDTDNENKVSGCEINDGGSEDGTGEVPKGTMNKIFSANEIPDSLKEYLLPINVSDSRGVKGENWTHPGDQCVDYSVSEAVALWKDTKPWSKGNGIDQVNAAIELGYAVKDDAPHKGDLVSCDGTDPSIGHTWIVGHVFKDGSVLVQEQNYPGKSGAGANTSNSWDVAVIPAYKNGAWSNLPVYGSTLDHPIFAKPVHGIKK